MHVGREKNTAARLYAGVAHGIAQPQTAESGVRFALGAVLAAGEILGGAAPFGPAFVGASGGSLPGLCALIGCGLGTFLTRGFADGMRTLSAAVLIFAVAFAFGDMKITKRIWFMPVVTGVMTATTGFVVLPEMNWQPWGVFMAAAEALLAGAFAWFYRLAFDERAAAASDARRRLCLLLLGATLLVALDGARPFGISLGKLPAVALVLLAAYFGGASDGAAAGVAVGMALDLSAGGVPQYTMMFGFSGLAAGLCRGKTRLAPAMGYILADGAAMLWAEVAGLGPSVLYETVLGSVLFLVLPERLLAPLRPYFGGSAERVTPQNPAEQAKKRLEASADAFRTLYESLRGTFSRLPDNDADVASVFDRAAGRVCRACPLQSACWQREYVSTFNAFNDATAVMLERGSLEPGDLPAQFASRCIRLPKLLAAVNEELAKMLWRRQYRLRLQESRQTICAQYQEISEVLRDAAADAVRAETPDTLRERQLRRFLRERGVTADCFVARDERGRLRAEICGEGAERLTEGENGMALATLLGVPLSETHAPGRLTLAQAEPLAATIGAAAKRKREEVVSGDGGTYFKTDAGVLYVLLADGMGCGEAAARESTLAARILERFLQTGMRAEAALKTLNSALVLRGEAEGTFTTVDLLEVDLFDGTAALYKYGAAPTYVRKGARVSRVTGASLPAGLTLGGSPAPDVQHFRLEAGDWVVLLTDGLLSGSGPDDWLRNRIATHTGSSPGALAQAVLEESDGFSAGTDDRTVLVLTLEARRMRTETPKKPTVPAGEV